MDWSKLSTGNKIGIGAGAVLVISLFLPWYSFGPFDFNAFDAEFWAWGGALIAIAGAVLLALKAFQERSVEAGNLRTEQIAFLLGAVGTIFIVIRWITENDGTSFGLYLGLLAAAGVTYGAFQAMKEAGLDMPSADDFKSIADGDGD